MEEKSEDDDSLWTPWRKVFRGINMLMAALVGYCTVEAIIAAVFWFLREVLKKKGLEWAETMLSYVAIPVLLMPVLTYYYEDFTEHGRRIRARNREYHKKVLEEQKEDTHDVPFQRRIDRQ